MDAEERFHQKRLGYVKYTLSEKHDTTICKLTGSADILCISLAIEKYLVDLQTGKPVARTQKKQFFP